MHPGTRNVGKVCKHIRVCCHRFQVLLMNTLLKQWRESTSPQWAANMQKLDSRSGTVHTRPAQDHRQVSVAGGLWERCQMILFRKTIRAVRFQVSEDAN